jgi:hypothetical protein
MKREILCSECGSDYFLMSVDRQRGFQMRRTEIAKVRCPAGLGVETTTTQDGKVSDVQYEPRYELHCDHCDKVIPEGAPALAATTWNTTREGQPGAWENSYAQ